MGRTLNSNEDSQFIINPPHPRTSQLEQWYKALVDPSVLEIVSGGTENSRDFLLNNLIGNKSEPGSQDTTDKLRKRVMLAEIYE